MKRPINEVLELVRTQADPQNAWADTLALCRNTAPSGLWDALPVPGIERDIVSATEWLASQLRVLPPATGLYLGLDTLNMRAGRGMNVEIGGSSECAPLQDEIEW